MKGELKEEEKDRERKKLQRMEGCMDRRKKEKDREENRR